MNPIDTGNFIRCKRKELKLSQVALGELLYVEPQTISKWERGLGMPDYDNLSRLKDIFNCSITDILEPKGQQLEELDSQEEQKEKIDTEKTEFKEKIKFLDYINPKKIKSTIEKVFGVEYVQTYNRKFLFNGMFKKKTQEDLENTLTQGMFKNKTSHPVLGLQAPWLYIRVLLFMLLCSVITFVGALLGFAAPFIVVAAFTPILPLLVFLFESNFSRDMSIISIFAIFMIGGVCSLLLAGITSFIYPSNKFVMSVLLAPPVEEIMKGALVIFFISKHKPKNILTAMLIGFAVGAGFSFFEDLHYALSFYLEGILSVSSEEGLLLVLSNVILRSLTNFFSGHHYWCAIYAAFYTFFNVGENSILKKIFNWRALLALLYSIILHILWNSGAWTIVDMILSSVLSVVTLIILINVGITQIKIRNIDNEYNSDKFPEK